MPNTTLALHTFMHTFLWLLLSLSKRLNYVLSIITSVVGKLPSLCTFWVVRITANCR